MDENTLFFNFLLYTGVQFINNTVLVSHVQQTDSVITIHVLSYMCIFQICFPFRLLHNIEQGSLCCRVGLCWLLSVCMSVPYSLTLLTTPSPLSFPAGNHIQFFIFTHNLRLHLCSPPSSPSPHGLEHSSITLLLTSSPHLWDQN